MEARDQGIHDAPTANPLSHVTGWFEQQQQQQHTDTNINWLRVL